MISCIEVEQKLVEAKSPKLLGLFNQPPGNPKRVAGAKLPFPVLEGFRLSCRAQPKYLHDSFFRESVFWLESHQSQWRPYLLRDSTIVAAFIRQGWMLPWRAAFPVQTALKPCGDMRIPSSRFWMETSWNSYLVDRLAGCTSCMRYGKLRVGLVKPFISRRLLRAKVLASLREGAGAATQGHVSPSCGHDLQQLLVTSS